MSKYNSINDAVRAKIDETIAVKNLDQKDFPYSSDVAVSLNQLSVIMGGSGNSMSIADSLGEVLEYVGGTDSSGDSPVLEWKQIVKPEDTFDKNNNGFLSINIEDFFGWTSNNDVRPWDYIKIVYNGKTIYSIHAAYWARENTNTETTTSFSYDLSSKAENYGNDGLTVEAVYSWNQSKVISTTLTLYWYGSYPEHMSGVSIYGALLTGWK